MREKQQGEDLTSLPSGGAARIEWIEEEPQGAVLSPYYKALKLPAARLFRSARVKTSKGCFEVGLGDFVHLSAGPENTLPYVARIAALFLNSNDGTKCMLAQWLYRSSDVSAKLPHNIGQNELFITDHCDQNVLEVVLEVVRCAIQGEGMVIKSTPFSKAVEQNSEEPHYSLRSVYDHKKHIFKPINRELANALAKYDDSLALLAFKLKSSQRKSKGDRQSTGSSVMDEPQSSINDDSSSNIHEVAPSGTERLSLQSDSASISNVPEDDHASHSSSDNYKLDLSLGDESEDFRFLNVCLQWTILGTLRVSDDNLLAGFREQLSKVEHILECSAENCWCSSVNERQLVEHAMSRCRKASCGLCKQFLPIVRIHSTACHASLGSCKVPRCEENKPSAFLEHAASCHRPRLTCSRPFCGVLKSLLQHATAECTKPDSCSQCRTLDLFIGLHEYGCQNKCKYPNCPHFASLALKHPQTTSVACLRSRKASSDCLSCKLYSRLRQAHVASCDAELGQCSFPLCPGRRQPILSDISSLTDEEEFGRVEKNKRMRDSREYSSQQPRVGANAQAAIPDFIAQDFPTASEQPTVFSSDISESIHQGFPDIRTGSIVVVEVPHLPASYPANRTSQYMVVRVVDSPDMNDSFTCLPYDAAWPTEASGRVDLSGIMHLLFRFKASMVVHPCVGTAFSDDYEAVQTLSKWTYSEVDRFTRNLLRHVQTAGTSREFDWFDEAVRAIPSKSSKEILNFWYALAAGVSHAPPGALLCSKCLECDAQMPCKRYFVCKTALCNGCLRAEEKAKKKKYDPSDDFLDEMGMSLWFCSECYKNGTTATTNVDLGSGWEDCQLMFTNDGYDETLAWNSRSLRGGYTLTDAERFLEQILLLHSHSAYDPLVDSLLTYGLKRQTADELMGNVESTLSTNSPELMDEFKAKFVPPTRIS